MPKQGVHVLQQSETTAKDTEGGNYAFLCWDNPTL